MRKDPCPDPFKTALIVIDMQRDFCAPGGYAAQAGLDTARLAQPIAHIQALLTAARQAGLLVVHTREGHRPDLSDCPSAKLQRSIQAGAAIGSPGPMGRLLIRGEHGHDFIDELQPEPGEVVIDKPGYGAFHQTDLARVLANRGITHLILCGVTTEVCVHSTLREAVDRGFICTTVGDACAASDPTLQVPALAMIGVEGGLFGQVLTTGQIVQALSSSKPETVPERYRGVWSRTLLETPDHRDDTSLVLWMQTDSWHADLRIPAEARIDRPQLPLSAMTPAQLQALAGQCGFCGITQVQRHLPDEPEVCTWHRHMDVQPPALTPDAGWMVFESDERVIETGVHGVYREVWERLPDSTGHFSVQHLMEGGRPTHLLTAGRYVMRVRPRQVPWPADTALGDTLAAVLARHPQQTRALLNFEVSFGIQDADESSRWTIQHSTLPELE